MKSIGHELSFDEIFDDVSGGNFKTQQNAYLSEGRFPVVDQGKELIAGFTDAASSVCKSAPPVIIFGDHTRVLKFIDFPFCMGADGVKVLKPLRDDDPKFLYHYLRYIDIPNAGYDRHFKYLKRLRFSLPKLPEQRRIAAILDQAEALRTKRRHALAKLDAFTQSIFREMFGEPSIDSPDFHPIALQELVSKDRPISYGILMPGPDQSSGVKYVRVVDMKDGGIELAGIRSTTQQISNAFKRSLLQSGDLVLSIRGHVGRLASVPDALQNANITQDTARLAITGAHPVFVREYLRTEQIQRWMKRRTKGMAVQGLNLADVKLIPIILPPPEQQQVFANAVACGGQVRSSVLLACERSEALFRSLQNRAFGAEL